MLIIAFIQSLVKFDTCPHSYYNEFIIKRGKYSVAYINLAYNDGNTMAGANCWEYVSGYSTSAAMHSPSCFGYRGILYTIYFMECPGESYVIANVRAPHYSVKTYRIIIQAIDGSYLTSNNFFAYDYDSVQQAIHSSLNELGKEIITQHLMKSPENFYA